jgi:sphingomyelin phosphodiesterase
VVNGKRLIIFFQVNETGRTMWYRSQDFSSNYPLLVNQAIKLFNLEQVAFEIENSVLSKVSCTACKGNQIT